MVNLRQSLCKSSVLILALVNLGALAQTSGSIYGTVTDDSGAVISGAADGRDRLAHICIEVAQDRLGGKLSVSGS